MIKKNILESNKLNKNISNWIDMIFAYKIGGKEGEDFQNLVNEAIYQ